METDLKALFREGAQENLTELEEALLALSENPENRKEVDRVFRAMHTIKGSSGMLGFEKISNFAHALETEFDAIRAGRASINPDIIQLALKASDFLQALVDSEYSGSPVADDDGTDILNPLKALIQGQCQNGEDLSYIRENFKKAGVFLKLQLQGKSTPKIICGLSETLVEIREEAQRLSRDSLVEFADPFCELMAEFVARNVRLSDASIDLFQRGIQEMEKLLEPMEEASADIDPMEFMAAMERPILISSEVRRLLHNIRMLELAMVKDLRASEFVHRIVIQRSVTLAEPALIHQTLSSLGDYVPLEDISLDNIPDKSA